jgi:hypothetical protein
MEIVDYASPCMKAEQALRDAHNAVLKRDLDDAIEQTMEALVQTRLMLVSLKHMKESANELVKTQTA